MKIVSKNKAKELINTSKGKIFGVTFTKKNGDDRVMKCTLMSDQFPEELKTEKKVDHNELLKEASNWNGMGQYWLGKQCEILASKLLQGNNETLLNQKIKSEEHFWKTKKFM